jgi:hypothetical protein
MSCVDDFHDFYIFRRKEIKVVKSFRNEQNSEIANELKHERHIFRDILNGSLLSLCL